MQPSHHTSESETSSTPVVDRHWGLTFLWLLPALFLILVVIYGVFTRQPDNLEGVPRVGAEIADFILPDLRGRTVKLSDFRGSVVFVNVWATWCPPCVEEMPTMQRLYDQLHDRGLTVLAVSIDALGEQIVAPFMQEHQLSFPALLDTQGTIERLYRTGGVPESFIIDKQGRLVEKVVGPRDWAHPQVIAMFERLLAAPMPKPARDG
jgi:peroxiredoxin